MNIALYHTTLPEPHRKMGGVEAVVHRLATALSVHARLNVTVLSLTPAPADAPYRHRQLFPNHRWLADRSWARWFVLPALLNSISLSEYDVVHLHGDDWFWMRRGIPSVRTMHGSAREEARTGPPLPSGSRLVGRFASGGSAAERCATERCVVGGSPGASALRPGAQATSGAQTAVSAP